MSILMWGRLALRRNYFVSTVLGAQLYSDQQLVTTGTNDFVCHPIYSGLILSAVGSLLIYCTWSTANFVWFDQLMFIRAWREEATLPAEFGNEWQEY